HVETINNKHLYYIILPIQNKTSSLKPKDLALAGHHAGNANKDKGIKEWKNPITPSSYRLLDQFLRGRDEAPFWSKPWARAQLAKP
ncbi:hypothetical protein TNCV_595601, partial [Trichonephila clavipes]